LNIEQIEAWKCTNCGVSYISKEAAEACCNKPKKVCEDCGTELDPKCYHTVCNSCREKRRYNRCRKMTIEEYEKEFPDCMVIIGNDEYFSSVEDALDSCYDNDEIPHYLYGTKKDFIEVNIDGAIENALEEAYEDAEFDNTKELYEFVEEWNKRNRLTVFYEAKIVIDIPEELWNEYIKK
jgi:hypothetical protein